VNELKQFDSEIADYAPRALFSSFNTLPQFGINILLAGITCPSSILVIISEFRPVC
jgi:hypothetical protein